jgi:hypothetical protein
MNPTLKKFLMLRFLLTPLLYFTRGDILYTLLLLIFLDIIDCNPLVISLFPDEYKNKTYCSLDKDYELVDKIIDSAQNLCAILLLRPILPKNIYYTVLGFLAFRIIGVIIYSIKKKDEIYVFFFEFVKEYLLVYVVFGANIPNSILLPAIALKIVYEYMMHSKHIALTIYKQLFERI